VVGTPVRVTDSVLLTGATGFVGSVVLAQLLERSDRDVVCVVRGDEPAARLAHVLDAVLGVEDPEQRARVRAVAGDVERPGVVTRDDADRVLDGVDTVVHCAAAISFDQPLAEARSANADGARNVARLAGPDRRLVHVSTAYVAGDRDGLVREDARAGAERVARFRNTYERTKAEGEASLPAHAAIVRPSIVVGETTTGWTSAFNVLYAPLKLFARGLLAEVPADPSARIDLVPVDAVADAVVTLAVDRREVTGPLHVASGAASPTLGEVAGLAAGVLDREPPRFGGGDLGVYAPYLDVRCTFATERAEDLLGPGRVPPFAEYGERIVAFAEAARWGKQPIRRADARPLAVAG